MATAMMTAEDLEFGFADRLRKARKAVGMSQQDVVDALVALGVDVKIASYSNWEASVSRPRHMEHVIRKLVEVYRDLGLPVTRGWFLGDDLPENASFADSMADLPEEFAHLGLDAAVTQYAYSYAGSNSPRSEVLPQAS